MKQTSEQIKAKEKQFHDEWAEKENPSDINVDAYGKSAVMPESRYIAKKVRQIWGGV